MQRNVKQSVIEGLASVDKPLFNPAFQEYLDETESSLATDSEFDDQVSHKKRGSRLKKRASPNSNKYGSDYRRSQNMSGHSVRNQAKQAMRNSKASRYEKLIGLMNQQSINEFN